MYKLLATDLDDTLLDHHGDVSKENIRAIEEAREQGCIIVLCSGRPSMGMHQTIEKLALNKKGEYYISFNGALIREAHNHNIIYEEALNEELCNTIIDLAAKEDLAVQLYKDDDMYVDRITPRTIEYERLTTVKPIQVEDIKQYTKGGALKLLLNDEPERLRPFYEKVEPILRDKLLCFFSRDHLLEFISNKTNKGVAVLALAEKMGVKKEEVIGVGDSFNDQYMIEMAGLGIAVSNGREEMKAIANYVTDRTNNEHAIEEVIHKFILK